MNPQDTIAAIASAAGGALRSIVRISGPDTGSVLQRLSTVEFNTPRGSGIVPLTIRLSFPQVGDYELAVDAWYWPDQRSYTRQPSAELHFPGSPTLVDLVWQQVLYAGARQAGPGEFTLRAFLAGRIDLFQAEAVLGVIDAADQSALRNALEQLAGGLSRPLYALQQELLNLLADVEAGLDFADEDIRFITHDELAARIKSLRTAITALREQTNSRSVTNTLPRVVLCGPPNAGKSTLFNHLIGEQRALVSPLAGTTRDYLRAEINCAGLPVELIDTAGTEANAADPIAVAAQDQLHRQLQRADLLMVCRAADQSPENSITLSSIETVSRLSVVTKCDLIAQPNPLSDDCLVSATTGFGLTALRERIAAIMRERGCSGTASTVARCQSGLDAADQALDSALHGAHNQVSDEWVAADLRAALNELGQLVGTIYTDDLLNRIFSRFCIGK